MIPYGRQDISADDVAAVVEVLNSDFLTQGPQVPRFEQTVAAHVGAKHAVAVNSATSALHIACLSLGLGHGDWLWTTPITFVASANCGLYCGAQVDFVDIDPVTHNISPLKLAEKLAVAQRQGCLPKVVVAVHLSGLPCDMKAIHQLAKQYGFYVIEDASHAIGAQYFSESVGNCRYSDITIFSFHPVKIITTAEGGMALTNSALLADKMRLYSSHGITRDENKMTQEPDGPWYYQQIELGYNYRMTELQAALGISQMTRLQEYIERRHELSDRYDQLLSKLPLQLPYKNEQLYSALHLYVVRLDLEKLNKTRKQVFIELREVGIGVNVHYIPVHLQPYYQTLGFKKGDFPEAERYYQEAISIPIFYNLKNSDQQFIVDTLARILMVD